MKFTTFILPALAVIATAVVAELASPVPAIAPNLKARDCIDSDSCFCRGPQGQFCGNEKINPACTNGHVFECNGQTGRTCDYGPRDSCRLCGKLTCPRA